MVFTYNPLNGWRQHLRNEFIWHYWLTIRHTRGFTSPPLGLSGIPNILTSVPSKKEKLPLSVTHPELAKEADGWDPSQVTFGSGIVKAWKCSKGHTWQKSINGRTSSRPKGCPVCAGRAIQVGFNDLATTHPELCLQIVAGDPRAVSAGSNQRFTWKCSKGHEFTATVVNRAIKKTSCAKCVNRGTDKRYENLADSFPDVASEALGWDPTEFSGGSGRLKQWKCSLGHTYEMKIDKRTLRKNGCPFCSGHQVLPGFNDLATTHPDLVKQVVDWNPSKFSRGSEYRGIWKCDKGHQWEATIVNRTNLNQGCPTCAITGFDPNVPAIIYLLESEEKAMYKIGITNSKNKRRLVEHKSNGWTLIDNRGPMNGMLAKAWEKSILRMLKARGADLSNSKIAGKFDGYSEAWSKSTFEVKSIKELMRLTEEYEEGN